MKIVLDAGHGKLTSGKRAPDDSMREYHFNSAVALYAKQLLDAYKCEVIFTHSDSSDVPLNTRIAKANIAKANVFVSIHANAYGTGFNSANGAEVFVFKKSLKEAVALASKVQTGLVNIANQTNRGVKEGNFAVLRDTNMTAILIEAAFMTNAKELALLKSDSYRRSLAKVIVDALVAQYKLVKKAGTPTPSPAPTKPATTPSSPASTQYRVICGVYNDKKNADARVAYLKKVGLGAFVEEKKQ